MREAGLYPYFRRIDSAQDTVVTIDGKPMLMLGSNSYMGLTNDPRIKEASKAALEKYGSGCAGSRFLNGTLDIHCQLEEELADFVGKDSALAFTTGFQANLGAISALVGKDDVVFIDRADHASIMDGCRLGFGKIQRFPHNDMARLERMLAACDADGKLIVVDGVYSMEGDLADLPALVDLCHRYKAGLIVDDAHGIGVMGDMGRGTANHFGLEAQTDLVLGTFSKSLASIGGFVAGSKEVINYLKHHARALIFSASMAPACVAAARKALEIIKSEPERHEAMWRNTRIMMDGLNHAGFDTGHTQTPIIPVATGDMMTCFRFWRALHDAGIFVNPVVPPATAPNQTLLRVSVMASHTPEQLHQALEVMERIGREVGLLQAAA
ncbi:MAG: pyridoxal phosphate-dependent aminotransferase family protein [Sumerlaeia bacterium]